MKKNIYLDKAEHDFVNTMPKGWCREVIQREMWEIQELREAQGERGEAIEAGRMIDETKLKIEGIEVDGLKGKDLQDAITGGNDAERYEVGQYEETKKGGSQSPGVGVSKQSDDVRLDSVELQSGSHRSDAGRRIKKSN
jgi:hypothetical protein